MRNETTELEIIMREALISSGLFFDEQVYTKRENGVYIFDFVVYGDYTKVIIECDGPHHYKMERYFLDSVRDLWSIQNGFQDVLRFNYNHIRRNIDGCIAFIKKNLTELDLALSHDRNRYQKIQEEKERIKLRKNSHFYTGEKAYSRYTGHKVTISLPEDITKSQLMSHDLPTEKEKELMLAISTEPENTNIHDEDNFPATELSVWETVSNLPIYQKKLLWFLIKNTNKDGIMIFKGSIVQLNYLIKLKLIAINKLYKAKGNEFSLFILPEAPYILRMLKQRKQKR